MARQNIAAGVPKNPNGGVPAADSADCAYTACDATNKEKTLIQDGKTYVRMRNTGASARNVNFTAMPDRLQRTVNITNYSLGAGEEMCFGPFTREGWAQTAASGEVTADEGFLYFEAAHAEVECRVETIG